MSEKTYKLTHSKIEPKHIMTPGLFRSIKKGERKTAKLDVRNKIDDDTTIRFWGPEPLGADDLRVLQGLVALAGIKQNRGTLSSNPQSDIGRHLQNGLRVKNTKYKGKALVVNTSYSELAREIGIKSGERRQVKESLRRLSAVTILVRSKKQEYGFHIFSSYHTDDEQVADMKLSGSITLAVNPLLAQALIGSNKQYIRIELEEVRQLKGEVARLIHTRLCSLINQNTTRKIGIEKIVRYAYPKLGSQRAERYRRMATRKALAEIKGLDGWYIQEYATDKFAIHRP